jgi:hypothetical protein
VYNVTKLLFIDEEKGYTVFIMLSVLCYCVKTLPSYFQQHDSSLKILGFKAIAGFGVSDVPLKLIDFVMHNINPYSRLSLYNNVKRHS